MEIPYHVKKNHSALEVDTFKVMSHMTLKVHFSILFETFLIVRQTFHKINAHV